MCIRDRTKNGRTQIIITEIPYMVNKARLIENMADLVKDCLLYTSLAIQQYIA